MDTLDLLIPGSYSSICADALQNLLTFYCFKCLFACHYAIHDFGNNS